jgi:hypothetical protein
MEYGTFKPFQLVLVRDSDQDIWEGGIYSHWCEEKQCHYTTDGRVHHEVLPYMAETSYLLGTDREFTPSTETERKNFNFGEVVEWFSEQERRYILGVFLCGYTTDSGAHGAVIGTEIGMTCNVFMDNIRHLGCQAP